MAALKDPRQEKFCLNIFALPLKNMYLQAAKQQDLFWQRLEMMQESMAQQSW